jgi:WXG100 family type VII secretion target
MTVHLTPQQAETLIGQIEASRDNVTKTLRGIGQKQVDMLGSNWHGDSASNFGKVSQQQSEDFEELIATLSTIVDKGSEHMRSVANADQH